MEARVRAFEPGGRLRRQDVNVPAAFDCGGLPRTLRRRYRFIHKKKI
jgi:hypothetical protein